MADNTVRGRFLWHELMSPDPKAAAAFYTKVADWETQPWENDPSYTMLVAGGRPMAGVMRLPEQDAPRHWLTYIGTPDVDATARHATALGGKVLKPAANIPDIGRFAILQDPQGAVFVAFTPLQAAGAVDRKPSLGDFSWHELLTTDWQAAFDFYSKLFGWEKTEAMDMGPGGTYQMYGSKGHSLGGMFNRPPEAPGPAIWLPYALVGDSKQVAETIKKLGGQIINGPIEVPGGDWVATGIDPQGVMFAVHSKKPAAAAAPAPVKRAIKAIKKLAKKVTPANKAAKKARPAKKLSKKKTTRASSKARSKKKKAGKKKARRGRT